MCTQTTCFRCRPLISTTPHRYCDGCEHLVSYAVKARSAIEWGFLFWMQFGVPLPLKDILGRPLTTYPSQGEPKLLNNTIPSSSCTGSKISIGSLRSSPWRVGNQRHNMWMYQVLGRLYANGSSTTRLFFMLLRAAFARSGKLATWIGRRFAKMWWYLNRSLPT